MLLSVSFAILLNNYLVVLFADVYVSIWIVLVCGNVICEATESPQETDDVLIGFGSVQ